MVPYTAISIILEKVFSTLTPLMTQISVVFQLFTVLCAPMFDEIMELLHIDNKEHINLDTPLTY